MTVKTNDLHSSGNNWTRNIKGITFLLETVQQDLLDTFLPSAVYINIQPYLKHSLVVALHSGHLSVVLLEIVL